MLNLKICVISGICGKLKCILENAKTQENLRFSVSYTVSNFIGDKILASYTHKDEKIAPLRRPQQKHIIQRDLPHL